MTRTRISGRGRSSITGTQHQIQEMEAFFNECPHPDDRQRKELSRELGLEPLQVKFWFQNKRTQMKAQHDRQENGQLRAENDRLCTENLRYKEALSSCLICDSPSSLDEMSFDEHYLRIENARQREEIQHERQENGQLRAENDRLCTENLRYKKALSTCLSCSSKTFLAEMSFDEHHLRIENAKLREETQHERQENGQLRAENDRLCTENLRYKEAISSCLNCDSPMSLVEMSFNEHHLRIENARLREETQHERQENEQLRAKNDRLRTKNLQYKETLSSGACLTCGSPAALGEMSVDEYLLRIENKRLREETQHERQENGQLRAKNDRLRTKNLRYKETVSSGSCLNCGSPAALGELSFDEYHQRIENERLREETQHERQENRQLRAKNNRLRTKNLRYKETLSSGS